MQIEVGCARDLASFVELLEEAGSWLWARGIRQWEPGSHRAQEARLRAMAGEGALLVARDVSGLAAGCLLTHGAGAAWAGHPGPAVYLHKLAVARAAAGRGLGARLVARAERWSAARAPSLRLDCWDGNHALRAYYRGLGFRELGAGREGAYRVRLFEKAPAPGARAPAPAPAHSSAPTRAGRES